MSQALAAAQDARRADSIRLLKAARLKQNSIKIELVLNPLLPEGVTDKPIKLEKTTPMQMRRRGCETRLIIGGTSAANGYYDSTLVKGMARAHVWFHELLSGKARSLLELARKHNVSESYVKKIMPLAFIDPKIVENALNGENIGLVTKQKIIRNLNIPIDWILQKKLVFTSSY